MSDVGSTESQRNREDRYAELAVRVGANVRPGQLVDVIARVEHAPVARAVAREAYKAGASYVDVYYSDQHIRRAMIQGAADEMLSWTPPWLLNRAKQVGDERAAVVALTGDAEPNLLADLPGDRVGKARMLELAEESNRQINEQLNNWTVIGVPNVGWAQQMFGEPDLERLWQAVEYTVRLNEDDPVAAWRAHVTRIGKRASALNDLQVDEIHFKGPGTDLRVGLLPQSRWQGCESLTAEGIPYVANMPTEEVFTTPDLRRAEGFVRSTRPLALYGRIVKGLEVRFEGGRIVDVKADEGADVVKGQLETDETAAYLGEIALVDGTSRIGQTGLTFFDTLFDENTTCHVAYGGAYAEAVEGGVIEGVNVSNVHTDFMVGGPQVDVDAVTRSGTLVPLLRDDVWQLPE
ncbi:MAG TPA: aminopeptidase [Gaiellaceae bacterium]|jgi:aminopeptidase|nr:aminopeptidase [Gaiellaceae bacterium]